MSATVPPFSQSTLYRLRAETVNLHNIWLTDSARSTYNFTYVNERIERGCNYEITRYDVYRIIYSDCGGAKLLINAIYIISCNFIVESSLSSLIHIRDRKST